jgi:preprotein translocase SecE subunit
MKQKSSIAVKKKSTTPRFRLFNDIISEMKKVTWLSRRELIYLTGLVLLVTVVMTLLLGILDFGFSKLIQEVFIGGG